MAEKCFACDRPLGGPSARAVTLDKAQTVYVGWECYRHILSAGDKGYQPPKGGPRLFAVTHGEER